MKKTQKRFLGYFGLASVAVMTAVAVNLPSPGASAINSVTDNIEVRVVGTTPAIEISSSVDGKTVSSPDYKLNINYENAKSVIIYQTYFDVDGKKEDQKEIARYDDLDATTGGSVKNVGFTASKYGKYIISAAAVSVDGAIVAPDDYIVFQYLPTSGKVEEDPTTGKYEVEIETVDDDVETIDVYVGDELIKTVKKGDIDKPIEFSLAGKPSGTYVVKLVAKDKDGNILYVPYTITINYEGEGIPDAGTPDTGGLFKNTNISNEDYLTTGLIVFFILGIVAFGVVARNRKPNSRK